MPPPTTAPVALPPGTLLDRGQSLLGLAVFLLLAYAVGRLRGARGPVPWRVVGWGVALQFAFGAIILFRPVVLEKVQAVVKQLLDYSTQGSRLIFGNLVDYVVPVAGPDRQPTGDTVEIAAAFAFVVLPTILFVSALTAVLYHVGLLTLVVRGLAWVMRRTMGTSAAETLSSAANVFVGQTEAPLVVRPFLAMATQSELMAIMVGGFANIASGVLVLYADWLDEFVLNAGGHLAAACLISAPATLVIAKLLQPETGVPVTSDEHVSVERPDANVIDAAARGTGEGVALALNVGAMVIVFTAGVAMVNGLIGGVFGEGVTLQRLLGFVGAPLMWLVGVPWDEATRAGGLLGIKTVLNELVAYAQMRDGLSADPAYLSPRSRLLTLYALCGFANFASVGIQIGGIAVLAPGRRADLSRLALPAMLGGAIATLTGACVVGVLV